MRIKLLSIAALFISILGARAQSSAFTYQGRLNSNGSTAAGTYAFQFTLRDAASTNAAQVGSIQILPSVAVSNGLFTVTLDFGSFAFTGAARYLEIGIGTNGSIGPFTTLIPLQPITSTPYAIQASTASTTTGAIGDAQLSANIPRLNGTSTFSGAANFSPASGAPFTVNNTNKVIGLNSDLFDGLDSTNFWKLGGNSGSNPGTDFLGTSDNKALELKVNNLRGLRLEPGANNGSHSNMANVIGGSSINFVGGGASGVTIAGGGAGSYFGTAVSNSVFTDLGSIGGGYNNTIQSGAAESTIAGGGNNVIQTNAYDSVIGGGINNAVTGPAGTVPGGDNNTAGTNSFAAGHRAKATHKGTFIWSDAVESDFASAGTNQFLIRAGGGVGIGKNNPTTALDVNGTVTATSFAGSVSATNLSGTVTSTLNFNPASGAPFTVGNSTVVANLNSDLLDGLDSTNFWKLNGNNVGVGQFLGSTNNQPLDMRVNNQRVVRYEYGGVSAYLNNGIPTGSPNVIHGSLSNSVKAGVVGATIGGGGTTNYAGYYGPNTVLADFGTVAGGYSNSASGFLSSVGGGSYNTAAGDASTVAGGTFLYYYGNTALAKSSTIGGGAENYVSTNGAYSIIAGGAYNGAYANSATIGGGFYNGANGEYSTIGGGRYNNASGTNSIVGGGFYNVASAVATTIGGGSENTNGGIYGTIAGGISNVVRSEYSTIGGGVQNVANQSGATVAGGTGNSASGFWSTVGGGYYNGATAEGSTVGGGGGYYYGGNYANGHYSTIGGGAANLIQSDAYSAFIGGGYANSIAGPNAMIGGGFYNSATGYSSTIAGGYYNFATGDYATIPGGDSNSATTNAFAAGHRAKANHKGAFVWADSTDADFASTATNQFLIRAAQVGIGTNAPSAKLEVVASTASSGPNTANFYAPALGPNFSHIHYGVNGDWYIRSASTNGRVILQDLGGSTARVGIGRAPTANKLEVEGEASKTTAGSWVANSDARIKTNIQTVTNALETLDKVHLVSFHYTDGYRAQHPSVEDRPYLNVIAQEFQQVFPEAVKTSGETLPDGSSILQVDTYPVTIYAAAAVQELNRKLEAQVKEKESEIQSLNKRLSDLEKMVQTLAEKK